MLSAFLDIEIDGVPTGRIVVDLYQAAAPLATKNFINLLPDYKNVIFHRVLKNFVIQLGDIDFGRKGKVNAEKLGTGGSCKLDNTEKSENTDGESPRFFDDENLDPLDKPFILCMANNGPNQNGSQFFITTFPQPHLSGKHTVFGNVVGGKSVVREIERVDTNKQNVPLREVVIVDCGIWTSDMPVPVYNASYDPRGGDIYEEYPDDDTNIDKESSESVFKALEKIKESGTLLFKAGEKKAALLKWIKCLRYVMEYFPDQDQEPEWYAKYMDIKKKLYLNMSLVCLQLKNYEKAVDYSSYLLDIQGTTTQEKAKAYFRMGSAQIERRKYKDAQRCLLEAKKLVDDKGVEKELERANAMLEKLKQNEREKYSKFFG